jgi:hypothetical protein
MMRPAGLLLLGLLAVAGLPGATFTDTSGHQVTGIYTDMHVSEVTGDIGGTEIFILRSNLGYHVLIQLAEGVPGTPVLVQAEVSGLNIEFELPSDSRLSGLGHFKGALAADTLRGRFSNSFEVSLPRGSSFWQ